MSRLLSLAVLLLASCATPALGQWDSNRLGIYYDSGQVGIGTSAPKTKLDVGGAAASGFGDLAVNETITSTWPSNGYYGYIEGLRADGKRGYYLGGNVSRDEAVLGVPHPSELIIKGAKVGVGTDTPTKKLSVNGQIRSKEVVIEKTNWPDYVFEESYDLPSLGEVSSVIEQKGHLPAVPSAESVEENGLRLGEMDATLLRKVEELTLYAIEQNKRADRQSTRIDSLQAENKKLRRRLQAQAEANRKQQRQIRKLMQMVQK